MNSELEIIGSSETLVLVDEPVIRRALRTVTGNRSADCRICMGPHDEDIHGATLNVRHWFRREVTKGFDIVPQPTPQV